MEINIINAMLKTKTNMKKKLACSWISTGVKCHACDFFLLSSELPCGTKWKTIQFKQ